MGSYWWLNLTLTAAAESDVLSNDRQDEQVQAIRIRNERKALHYSHRRWMCSRDRLTLFPGIVDTSTKALHDKDERSRAVHLDRVRTARKIIRLLFEQAVAESCPGSPKVCIELFCIDGLLAV